MGAAYGSRNAAKWTEEEIREKFEAAYEYALNDPNALCVQDLFIHMGISRKYFYKLIARYEEYEEIHGMMKDALIAKVNRGALKADYVSTPAIWRMKQLGEKDTQYTDFTTKGESLNDLSKIPTDELIKRAEAISKLKESE